MSIFCDSYEPPRQSYAFVRSHRHLARQDAALSTCPTKAAKSGQVGVAWTVAPVSWVPSLSDTCTQESGSTRSVTATSADNTWLGFKVKESRRADIQTILILLAVARIIGLGLVKLCKKVGTEETALETGHTTLGRTTPPISGLQTRAPPRAERGGPS